MACRNCALSLLQKLHEMVWKDYLFLYHCIGCMGYQWSIMHYSITDHLIIRPLIPFSKVSSWKWAISYKGCPSLSLSPFVIWASGNAVTMFVPDNHSLLLVCCFTDIDECSAILQPCNGDNVECINDLGGFHCQCDGGYGLNTDNRSCSGGKRWCMKTCTDVSL